MQIHENAEMDGSLSFVFYYLEKTPPQKKNRSTIETHIVLVEKF